MRPLSVKHPSEFGRVAVLMGGTAAEREISLKSGKAVEEALCRSGIETYSIDVQDEFITQLREQNIDRVFNIVHGRGGEDGVLQGVLEMMNIPYTGSSVMASALSMDKLRTKLCWQGYRLATPKWHVLKGTDDLNVCLSELDFPLMVKPSLEGSSLGMSKAEDRQSLALALDKALQFDCDVFAEEWVNGKEYTVAVLNGEALPVIGLDTPNQFYDYEAKYQATTTQYLCPCGLSKDMEQHLQSLALSACDVIGVKGWARVDMFLDERQTAQLIEVNTVPGMTDHSLVPMAAKEQGIDFEELVWRILETSLNG